MLLYLVIIQLLVGFLLIVKDGELVVLKRMALISSLMTYVGSLIVWFLCRLNNVYIEEYLVVDGLSSLFLVLTGFLILVSILSAWKEKSKYLGIILVLGVFLIGVFVVGNILYFYILFEGALVPIYLLLGFYGSRERRVKAGNYLFMYTFSGSLIMLLGVLLIYVDLGSLENNTLCELKGGKGELVWLALFTGMMVKIPLLPAHIWLAEAHVEAPTEGSVILAGILLKLGTYGFVRYNIDLLGEWSINYRDFVSILCILGIVYTSLTAIRQTDIKRVIAYGSVGHMSMVILGIISGGEEGYVGGILQMISHGIISGALFLVVGILYKRVGSRYIWNISGLVESMPKLSTVFFLLIVGNMGLPGTSAFVGEFLIVLSLVEWSILIGLIGGIGIFLCGAYSLYLYNRIIFGNMKENIGLIKDIDDREGWILMPLVLIMISLGVFPGLIINTL